MKKRLGKFIRTLKSLFVSSNNGLSDMEYWEKRSKQYGKRSVLNISHTEEEFESVTQLQKREIFPHLKDSLKGDEKLILDFGCGPGRFTKDLAEIIKGKSIGVEPISHFIKLANEEDNTEYKVMQEGIIPMEDNSVDIIWVCLVIGGITEENVLSQTILEMRRVLKKDGMIFLIENTSDKPSGAHWKFKTVENYQSLFSFVKLKHLSDYFDVGERISIMAGR